jgi:hypothetical protein
MPIHQVKGLSMDRAVIDIGSDVFAHSQLQAYVALSRVHSLEGMLLSNFMEAKFDRPLVFGEYDIFLVWSVHMKSLLGFQK